MQLSPLGRRFIQAREGLRLTAYPDGGKYSIGYGHHGVAAGTTITRAQAEALFDQDVARFSKAVNALVASSVRPTSQRQFDALVSFAYNVGEGGVTTGAVAQLHRAGEYQGAADALRAWRKSEGEVNGELVARRELERTLYLGGPYTLAPGMLAEPPSGGLMLALGVAAAAYWLLPKVPATRRLLA